MNAAGRARLDRPETLAPTALALGLLGFGGLGSLLGLLVGLRARRLAQGAGTGTGLATAAVAVAAVTLGLSLLGAAGRGW